MSFLAPIFLAGLAALALPVIFHLIRRAPADRLPFSSVMFLKPSPPRLTRRSRIEHWLLLVLRAAALALLALAFARPFFSDAVELPLTEPPGRRVAILVDTSSSMRRDDLFAQARGLAEKTLNELRPRDEVGLFTFDRRVATHVGWDENSPLSTAERRSLVRQKLAELEPTWQSTNLGAALVQVADMLEATREAESSAVDVQLEIVLVSDLQRGGRLESLQDYPWPESVRLSVEQVEEPATTNAALRLVERGADGSELAADSDQRVRVTNAADSRESQFQIQWQGEGTDKESSRTVGCYVPPGESRVVKLPVDPTGKAVGILLTGDDQPFDNLFHAALPPKEQLAVQYFGSDAAEDPAGLYYFLARAFPDSARRTVAVGRSTAEVDPSTALFVVAGELSSAQSAAILEQVQKGSNVLCVLSDAEPIGTLQALSGDVDLRLAEAEVPDYAILSHVDLKHPLLSPFADSRFSDFTKIHFWHHRQLEPSTDADWQVVARFDSGDPALLAKRLGRGELYVLTSSWRPADSQLALSTKFVPLLGQMLEPRHESRHAGYEVGSAIPLAAFPEAIASVRLPDGEELKLEEDQKLFDATDAPGIYTFVAADGQYRVAVNLAASESDTAPRSVADFEPYGVNVPAVAAPPPSHEAVRKLHDAELERRQSLWRWLILGVLGILLIETVLAGRMTRSPTGAASLSPSPT